MSDYSRQQDFNAKTGTTIFGSEVDSEFDALVTAVNSKVDESREGSASGIATLDGSALIPAGISGLATSGGGQMPEASATALGAVELANTSEATTLTDALRVITPDTLDDVLSANDGVAKDLQALTGQAADSIYGWDTTASAAIGFTIGNGLESSTTNIQIANSIAGTGLAEASGVVSLSHLGIESLADAGADALLAWDDTAGAAAWFTAADGLEFTNATTSIGLADVAAGAAQPVTVTAGTFSLNLSSLTELVSATGLAATDRILIDDAGTPKAIEIQEAGMRVLSGTATNQTVAAEDMNAITQWTAVTTLTLPLNSATPLPVGVPMVLQMLHATELLTITAASGVTLVSTFHPGGLATGSDVLKAGGTALLYKTAADTWCLTGDTKDA